MEIYFYRIAGMTKDIWFTNSNGVVILDWCLENNVRYKIDYYDGFRTGIILDDDKDKVYFELKWGGIAPTRVEDYID